MRESPTLRGLRAMRAISASRPEYDLVDVLAATPRDARFAAMDALNRWNDRPLSACLERATHADILALLDRAIAAEVSRG